MLRRSLFQLNNSTVLTEQIASKTRLFARLPLAAASSSSSPLSTQNGGFKNQQQQQYINNNRALNRSAELLNDATASVQGSGKSFEGEERHCGMLFTLAQLKRQSSHIFAHSNAKSSPKTNSLAMKNKDQIVFVAEGSADGQGRRLGCVVKGCSADWQVNEIYSPSSTSATTTANENVKNDFFTTTGNNAQSIAAKLLSTSLGSRITSPSTQRGVDDDYDNEDFLRQQRHQSELVVATLNKMPKGSWKKISGATKKQIETNADELFSDPNKHFRELYVTHGTYAFKKGKVPVDKNVLEFSLYRENTPLRAVARRMQKKLRIKNENDDLLSTPSSSNSDTNNNNNNNNHLEVISQKESYGCVTQLGRIQNISMELLPHASRHYNINAVLFNPVRYLPPLSDSGSSLESHFFGNRWRVMLRCVDGSKQEIESALSRLATHGAINYFNLRSLGGAAAGGSAVDIASAVSRKNYFDACRYWLQNEAARDFVFQPHYSRYLAADDGSVGGLMEMAARDLSDAKASPHLVKATRFLADFYKDNYYDNGARRELDDEICESLWNRVVSKAIDGRALIEAPDNFLWNLAASQRLLKHGAEKIVAGDCVLIDAESDGTPNSQKVKIVESDLEGKQYSVADHLVIPFAGNYYCGTEERNTNCWYSDFYKNAQEKFSLPSLSSSSSSFQNKRFRKLIVKSTSPMQAVVVSDPNSLSLLKTDLFLRQERKSGTGENITLEDRFRKPTLFNVSDAFRTIMQDSIHNPPPSSSSDYSFGNNSLNANARCSVALEVDLPAGSHILPFLREAFLVKHLHYLDQLDIVTGY